MTRRAIFAFIITALLISAPTIVSAAATAPNFVQPYFFFDDFPGTSLDTTTKWDAANGVTVSDFTIETALVPLAV